MSQRISDEEIRQQVLKFMFQLGISPTPQYENLILDGGDCTMKCVKGKSTGG